MDHNINLNITAIFTLDQIKAILHTIRDTKSIISVFAGRIYDVGLDASEKLSEISNFIHENSTCDFYGPARECIMM